MSSLLRAATRGRPSESKRAGDASSPTDGRITVLRERVERLEAYVVDHGREGLSMPAAETMQREIDALEAENKELKKLLAKEVYRRTHLQRNLEALEAKRAGAGGDE
eukprot:PLAT3711.1.p1 GENE.PLAT3711.1~~PLAT3711.1.p1  ORF type:complete len:114 (+),score=28.29 PLAT3711.1:24-344(+)